MRTKLQNTDMKYDMKVSRYIRNQQAQLNMKNRE